MRELKFRGKRRNNNKWVYGYFTKNETSGNCYITTQSVTGGARPNGVDPVTVGEYTGFCDKNGKEAYEGDIVKWTSLYVDNIDGDPIGEITFFKGCWFIQGKKHNGYMDNCLSFEVIGNIYESPELLEGRTC